MNETHPIVLFTGIQRLARQLRQKGLRAACLRQPGEEVASPGDVSLWVPYDPQELSALERWARRWPLRDQVAGVINRRERRVMEHAVLNLAFGRPGLNLHQARILRDKFLLRKALADGAPHLNPPFELVSLASRRPPSVRPPYLIKPLNLFKSQLITPCFTRDGWAKAKRALRDKREATARRHGVALGDQFLAEGYVEGLEVSVEAFVGSDGEITYTPTVELTPARHWDMEDFHVAVRHLPSSLSFPEEARAWQAVREVVEALKLKATPLHVDIVLAEGDPLILDVAPRVGGFRSEMMDLAHGCPLDPVNLELAMGRRPRWEARWKRAVAVAEIFPSRPGRLTRLRGLEQVRSLSSFFRLRQRIPTGEEVGLARDGFRCPLFVILAHPSPNRVREDLEVVRRRVRLDVEPI